MDRQHTVNDNLEPTIRALGQLSPQSQRAVISLVRQLAQREGIDVPLTASQGLQSPIDGVPMWTAKLRAERYSERTAPFYATIPIHSRNNPDTAQKKSGRRGGTGAHGRVILGRIGRRIGRWGS